MMNDEFAKETWFRQAQRLYLDQFDEKLVRLRKLNQTLKEHPDSGIEEIYRAFHHLTGSGATYGFPEISNAAQPICDLLRPIRESGNPVPAPVQEAISHGIQVLDQIYCMLDNRLAELTQGTARPEK